MRTPTAEFFARQFFLITALLICFCLGHSLSAGSLFSSAARAEFEKSRAEAARVSACRGPAGRNCGG